MIAKLVAVSTLAPCRFRVRHERVSRRVALTIAWDLRRPRNSRLLRRHVDRVAGQRVKSHTFRWTSALLPSRVDSLSWRRRNRIDGIAGGGDLENVGRARPLR
jgi:hypothetical protein